MKSDKSHSYFLVLLQQLAVCSSQQAGWPWLQSWLVLSQPYTRLQGWFWSACRLKVWMALCCESLWGICFHQKCYNLL